MATHPANVGDTMCIARFGVVQVRSLFPSARGLKLLWHSVVKISQSLYREAPGMDVYRPDQVRLMGRGGPYLFPRVSHRRASTGCAKG